MRTLYAQPIVGKLGHCTTTWMVNSKCWTFWLPMESHRARFQRRRHVNMGHATWAQPVEDGTVRRSKCDHIFCQDKRLFTNVALREPETCSKTDHFMIKASFLNATPRAHKKCLLGRKKTPPQHNGPCTPADNLFRILVDNVPRPAAESHPKTSWISQETRRSMAKRCRLRRDEHHSRQQARALTTNK